MLKYEQPLSQFVFRYFRTVLHFFALSVVTQWQDAYVESGILSATLCFAFTYVCVCWLISWLMVAAGSLSRLKACWLAAGWPWAWSGGPWASRWSGAGAGAGGGSSTWGSSQGGAPSRNLRGPWSPAGGHRSWSGPRQGKFVRWGWSVSPKFF